MSKFEVDGAGAAASIIPIDRAEYMPAGVAVWLRYLEHWRVSYRSLAYMQVGRWWDGGVRSGGWWHSPGEQGHTAASLRLRFIRYSFLRSARLFVVVVVVVVSTLFAGGLLLSRQQRGLTGLDEATQGSSLHRT